MRRWIWIVVAAAVVAAGILGWPKIESARLSRAAAGIEATEDPSQRVEKAVAFLTAHADAPEPLFRRVFAAGHGGADAVGGPGAVAAYCDRLLALDLPKRAHEIILPYLDGALLDTGEAEAAARADGLARDAIAAADLKTETYLFIAWQHAASENADPRTTVEIALYGSARGDSATAAEWPAILDRAYASLLWHIAEDRGLDAAIAVADSVIAHTDRPLVAGVIYAGMYRLLAGENEADAIAAARNLASLTGFRACSVLNEVAYDMAERNLAPDVAVSLAESALALAPTSYDSLMVLDTAGWAAYRAGRPDVAVERLRKAVSLLDETPSYGNGIVAHLVTALRAAGKTDEAIDLLALLVARSADPDDPARTELRALLRRRDGSDANLETLVASKMDEGLEPAPGFALADRGGRKMSLKGLRGSVVLLCFWSYG